MATATKKDKYYEAVGKRKTSVARVRLTESSKSTFVVNDKDVKDYFPTNELQALVRQPLTLQELAGKYSVSVKITGGGIHSQAEAVRHGIARALVVIDENQKKPLKDAGFLTRDSRIKERRKFGLKKARKAPQWSKR